MTHSHPAGLPAPLRARRRRHGAAHTDHAASHIPECTRVVHRRVARPLDGSSLRPAHHEEHVLRIDVQTSRSDGATPPARLIVLLLLAVSAAYVAWHLNRGWVPLDEGAL